MPEPVSLSVQLACARRELALRRSVYTRWVVKGQMTQAKATAEIAAMAAVCETLDGLLNTTRRDERAQLSMLGEEG